MHPDMLSDHVGPLVGGEFTLRDSGRSDSRTWRPTSHVMVACQNATGSCSPYNRAGWPDDECRFAAWVTLVNSGVLDVAFLVNASLLRGRRPAVPEVLTRLGGGGEQGARCAHDSAGDEASV